ncbi:TRAP transporter substrate-binding protein [Psychromonas sp. 14N.309.X.WAT.B.A12]|uniref:TRAP transporter substrate-binding protein n=1 Tax=unclassified Psychromonas TaxID=2614957 RepID=UPI0025B1D792|nr:DctP family TRAP transporter solute-binding subunit [Psychromonas sp. 14N.309.X.WAT.B.A12]MDN2664676.1 DctP family TRAP transporter solute-binding subunit [Psychromonas sp. 14N.309.X.WAT.B.A12]
MKKSIIAALTLFMSTSTLAAEFNFTFAHVLSDQTPNGQAVRAFAKEVNEKSDGRINVMVLPAGQLGGDVEIIEQLQMNMVQIAIPPTATLGNFEPRVQILDLPFLLPSKEVMKKVLDGPTGRKILDTLDGHGMHAINFWGAGFRHMTNNVRPINSPDDLKGLKMRTMQSPILLSTYRNFDANPTAMAYSEVYNGLQQSVIEGQENPIANITSKRFYEVQKYMTLTANAYHGYAAIMNDKAWASLPDDLKVVMTNAFNYGRDVSRDLTDKLEADALDNIKKHTEVTELSPEQIQVFVKASLPVHEEFRETITSDLLDDVYADINELKE